MMKKDRLEPWKILKSQEIFVAEPWIKLSTQQILLPDGRVVDNYYQIMLPEFTMIYAQTADGRVIIERQYKHGIGRVSLMLPAGLVNDGEAPLAAARRELLEETGYDSNNWQSMGHFVPNTNYGCGKAHLFLARDAEQVATPDSGDLEEMEIILMTPEDVTDAIFRGEIVSLSTVATIALATNPLFTPVSK